MARKSHKIEDSLNLKPLTAYPDDPQEGDVFVHATLGPQMYYAGNWINVALTRRFDETYTSDPSGTIAHDLGGIPETMAIWHDELANDQFAPLDPHGYIAADDTNLYVDVSALIIDNTRPLRIIATVGVPGTALESPSWDYAPTVRIVSTNATAVHGDDIIADASGGAFTITAPAGPSPGDRFKVRDAYFDDGGSALADSWAVNNVTLARNGSSINGDADNLILDTPGGVVELIYVDASLGWRTYF